MKPIMIRGWDPTQDWRQHRLLIVVILGMLVLGAAGAGYLIGSSAEADTSPSGAVGAAVVQDEPGAADPSEDRAAAFEAGRTRGFEVAYARGYRSAYVKEFRKQGLGAPARVRVPDRAAPPARGPN